MSSQMILRDNHLPTTRVRNNKISRQAFHEIQTMQGELDVGGAALYALSRNHSLANFEVANTLNTSDLIQQVRRHRGASQAEEAAYQRRIQQYLSAVEHATGVVDTQILLRLQQLSFSHDYEEGNSWLDRLDAFFKG